MTTFEKISFESNNRPNGFDYLRIILAIAIIGWHSLTVVYPADIEAKYFIPLRPLILFLVPSFFALSGFLVSGSLFRTQHLPTFLTLRALRIFPALFCEVIISAFLIGALLTKLPLGEYFSHPMFHSYFLNIIGDIHYTLPGVFEENRYNYVNTQLWTIPYELECYIAISILYILTLHKRPKIFVAVLSIITLIATWYGMTHNLEVMNFRPTGRFAVASFLWGVVAYVLKDKIPHNRIIFAICVVFAWAALHRRFGEFLAAPAIAYITIYIGLIDYKKTFLLLAGDISYGLYLYGFAIQQAVYQTLPQFRTWTGNFLISLAIASIVGYISWVYVESKVLDHKKFCIAFVRSITDRIWTAPKSNTK